MDLRIPHTRINSKCINDLIVQPGTIAILGEIRGGKSHDVSLAKISWV
jgi:hypothetical protein